MHFGQSRLRLGHKLVLLFNEILQRDDHGLFQILGDHSIGRDLERNVRRRGGVGGIGGNLFNGVRDIASF